MCEGQEEKSRTTSEKDRNKRETKERQARNPTSSVAVQESVSQTP